MGLIVVLGTGTNVGKTHVGCALARALRADGVEVAGLKPVESGMAGGGGDAGRLAEASGSGSPPLHAFDAPIAPHLAARLAGVVIGGEEIGGWVRERSRAVTLVETAGGALSPLSESLRNVDLVPILEPSAVLLVAPDRLGVLHDLTVTLEALARRGLTPVVVLSSCPPFDEMTDRNAAELARLGVTEVAARFPHAPLSDHRTLEASLSALRALERFT